LQGFLNSLVAFSESGARREILSTYSIPAISSWSDGTRTSTSPSLITSSAFICSPVKQYLASFLPSSAIPSVEAIGGSAPIRPSGMAKQGNQRDKQGDNSQKFKEEYPKIAIVTDMLITGFDHPQLQTTYLDKPLKGHLLLQTVARVNRPAKKKR